MLHLVIDIGNSRTKVAIFDSQELIVRDIVDNLNTKRLAVYLDSRTIIKSIVSSVKDDIKGLEDLLSERTQYTRFSSGTKAGVTNLYKSPESLGQDRLAGVIGAKVVFPEHNCLVIDIGTCITYDAIDKQGTYRGGNITPGLNMKLKAMHELTGRLPLVKLAEYEGLEGNDTQTSMLSGVVNGTYSEIIGFIEQYRSRYSELKVILCGGDANFFDTRLKNSIFAHTLKTVPDLVLIGLNEVINQQ